MMAIRLQFTPIDPKEGSADPFWVTFDDDDLPVEVEGETAYKGNLARPQWHKRGWWLTGLHDIFDIKEVPLEGEETPAEDTGETGEEAAKFEVAKLDTDKRLVFGWAYVTHDEQGRVLVDKSGEFIDDPEELERAAYEFVIKSRRAGDMHHRADDVPVEVGTMVESMVMTPEKASKMGIPPGAVKTGWWCGFRIENDTVWQAVKNGERPAFSIHGKARKEPLT